MKKINNKGISLIVLIITIIVVIILAAVVILTLSKNNPINSAKEAAFKDDIYNFKTELEVYKAKISRNGEDVTKLYASKDSDPSIQDVITSITRKYIDRIEVREGKLVYVGNDKTEYILAKDMGLLPEDELLDDDILTELKPFVTEWTVEAGDSITLPIGGTCNFTVDYGDGTGEYKVTSNTDEDRIHKYENAGTYTVKITGKCEKVDFYNFYFSKDKITKIVQWGNIGVKVINFSSCSNLAGTIPEPQKNTFENTENMENLFYQCRNITGTIPENIFKNATKVKILKQAFRGCGVSGSIPEKLLQSCINLTSVSCIFCDCNKITGSIPADLFKNNINITEISAAFYNCSGLTGEIPEDLFKSVTKAGSFYGIFLGCKGLTGKIPDKLFYYNTNANTFIEAFVGCTGLSGSIPEDLFINCTKVTNFCNTFNSCSNLTGSIPESLFKNCNKVQDFSNAFRNCKNLSGSIPEKLFINKGDVKTYSCVFCECENLTGNIPENLFSDSPNVTSFYYAFAHCKNLSGAIPTNLFNNCNLVKNFEYTFCNCKGLNGNAPELWNRDNVTAHGGCFSNCTNLSNYNNIPSGWK